VRALLLSGGKYSARDINRLCNTNDARKCISTLISRYHMKIRKAWTDGGFKLYWYESESMPTLFDGKEALL